MSGGGVLVALSSAPSSPEVLARAVALAADRRAALTGVHVRTSEDPGGRTGSLDEQVEALEAVGGRYLEVSGDDVAEALVRVATSEGADQIVVGASGRSRWQELRKGALVNELTRRSPVDVHVVVDSHRPSRRHRPRGDRRLPPLERRRRTVGWVLSILVPAAVAAGLVAASGHVDLAAQLVIMLLAVLFVAAVGGLGPGTVAALWANVLANWYFIPPVNRLSISRAEDALALTAFLVVALVIGGAVSTGARRGAEAGRARADAAALATLAGTATSSDDAVGALVEQLRVAVGATGAELHTTTPGATSTSIASAGNAADTGGSGTHDRTAVHLTVDDTTEVTLHGEQIHPLHPDVMRAFLNQLSLAVEHRRLRAAEEESQRVAQVNELRATLLAAVSHDLRTPLATMKASSSALVQLGDEIDATARADLAVAVDDGVDRLTALVTNLLGMSRIQAGAVDLDLRPVRIDEVVHRAAIGVSHRDVPVRVELAEDLPSVVADPALLEHVVANLLDNACKWAPSGTAVTVDAYLLPGEPHRPDTLVLRVVDHGPGIPAEHRQRVRAAFERATTDSGPPDTAEVEGIGLGLSVATGFCSLMGITLLLDDTGPGRSGTTASLFTPLAAGREEGQCP